MYAKNTFIEILQILKTAFFKNFICTVFAKIPKEKKLFITETRRLSFKFVLL
jgi:hypothetical protein